MYDLGDLLKQLREEKNVSMDKMVEDLKSLDSISIAKSTISKWENNKADPSMGNAKILCNYFNVSLDYLLGLSKYKNKEEELAAYKNKMIEFDDKHNKNLYEKQLLNSFNKLNDKGKNEAIKRVDELTELSKYQKEEDNKVIELPNSNKETENEITATKEDDIIELPKESKKLKDISTTIAAHDDDLTNSEKEEMDKRILEFLNNKKN